MDFDEYQKHAGRTVTFSEKPFSYQLMYLGLSIAGESGEVAEKIKKVMRNDDGALSEEKRVEIQYELGDVLWAVANLARILDIPLSTVAKTNIEKINDRMARGVTKSSGDNR